MDPLTTAFVLAPTAIKLGTGIAQTIKGNKMGKDNPRPEFEIPTAAIGPFGRNMIRACSKLLPIWVIWVIERRSVLFCG